MAKLNEVRFNRKYTENQLKQFADDLATGKPTPLVDGTYYQPDSGGKLYYYSVKTGLSIAGEKNNFIGFYLGEHDPQHPEKNPMVSGGIVEITPDAIGAATPKEVDDKIKAATTSVYKFKGSVVSYDRLPSNPNDVETGDVYDVNNGTNYAAIIEENGYSALEEYLQVYRGTWTFGNIMRRLGVSVDNVAVDYEYKNDVQSVSLNGRRYEPGELTVRPVLKGSSVYFMAKPSSGSYQYVIYDNNNLVTRDLSDSDLSSTLGLPYTQHKAKTVVWDSLGGIFDTTNLATKTELAEHKQEVQSTIDTHKQQVQTSINTAKQQVQAQITNIENAMAEKDAVHADMDATMNERMDTISTELRDKFNSLGTAAMHNTGVNHNDIPVIGSTGIGKGDTGRLVAADADGNLMALTVPGGAVVRNATDTVPATDTQKQDLVSVEALKKYIGSGAEFGTAAKKDVGSDVGQVPLIGNNLGTTDGTIVVVDEHGQLSPGSVAGNAVGRNVADSVPATDTQKEDLVSVQALKGYTPAESTKASQLKTERTINGLKFDGSKNVDCFLSVSGVAPDGPVASLVCDGSSVAVQRGTRITVKVSSSHVASIGDKVALIRIGDNEKPIYLNDELVGSYLMPGIYDMIYDDTTATTIDLTTISGAWHIVSGGGSGKLYWEE